MAYVYKLGAAAIAISAALAAPAAAKDDTSLAGATTEGETDIDASTTSEDEAEGRVTVRAAGLDPRYGNIDPFYGDIGAFWGDISPFYGDIGAFYGTINPFWDDISPFYGNIGAFWGDIGAFWGNIGAFENGYMASIGTYWAQTAPLFRETEANWAAFAANPDDVASAAALSGNFDALIAQAETQWGARIMEQTSASFDDAFLAPILARHGIDGANPASFAALDARERAAFFLDWHDSLMAFSGIDFVDHWMGAVNWTPVVTQIQGSQGRTMIGIIDSDITGSSGLANNVMSSAGSSSFVSGHGAGVASLIIAEHDGSGVMGIAPNAKVVTFNPFDADQTASWADVQDGIVELAKWNASIINLSLGEPGKPLSGEWRNIFASPLVAPHAGKTAYVLAAGNDGVTQSSDVEWSGAFGTNFLLVGSVAPNGDISSFSNRPGEACLLNAGVCSEKDKLKNRFIVAPGEMLLVDDGHGGVTRRSGTSFAAPLVSGAIALLHDRWPWLANHAGASTEIILRSARDLGAPGVDPVYGVGMLDVVGSQSPLDFGALTFQLYQVKGAQYRSSNVRAADLLTGAVPNWWETRNVFFTMFETVGGTYRDFAVPMSSYAAGKRTNVLRGSYERLQDYVSDRFTRWIVSGGTDRDGDGVPGLTQIHHGVDRQAGAWTLRYTSALPRMTDDGALVPVHSGAELTDPSGRFAFNMGYGQGAMTLTGERFSVLSDFDRTSGGVNPLLGFASGEFFAAAGMRVGRDTMLRFGYSENRHDADDIASNGGLEGQLLTHQAFGFGAQEAHAFTADLEHRVSDRMALNLQYTNLREENATLGGATSIGGLEDTGSHSDALTVSGTFDLDPKTRIDLSATASRTTLADGHWLSSPDAALGTAAQIALTRKGLLGENDTMRFTLGQPLKVERGELAFDSLQVIDRETGERGRVTQTIGIETKRRLTGEMVYTAPIADQGEFGLFGRYVGGDGATSADSVMVGASFGLRF